MSTTQELDLDPTNVNTHSGYCPGCSRSLAAMDELIPAWRGEDEEPYALCCPNDDCWYQLKRL